MEQEANLFALFLLMPKDLLIEEIRKIERFDWCDDKAMKALCEKFGVSLTALTVRLGYLSRKDKQKIGLIP